jgi:hypothetical protein
MPKRQKPGPSAGTGQSEPVRLFFSCTKRTYCTVDEFYAAVLKAQRSGRARYWSKVAVIKLDSTVVLECRDCGKHLSARNPTDSCSTHFKEHEKTLVCKQASRFEDEPDQGEAATSAVGVLSAIKCVHSVITHINAIRCLHCCMMLLV